MGQGDIRTWDLQSLSEVLAGARAGGYSSRPLHSRAPDVAAQTTDRPMHLLHTASRCSRALRTRPHAVVAPVAVRADAPVVVVLVVVTDSP